MKVNTKIFLSIAVIYMLVLSATGYLTFIKFPSEPTLPSQTMIDRLSSDPDFKSDLLEDIKTARERKESLIRLSAHSFDVILGALLGFLSAFASARLGLNNNTPCSGTGQDNETAQENVS